MVSTGDEFIGAMLATSALAWKTNSTSVMVLVMVICVLELVAIMKRGGGWQISRWVWNVMVLQAQTR